MRCFAVFVLALASVCAFAQQTPQILITGSTPRALAFAPSRQSLLVTSAGNSELDIFDLTTLAKCGASCSPARVVSSLGNPAGVAVDDLLGLAVVVDTTGNQVSIIDLKTLQATPVPVESLPYSVDINLATHTAVVANSASRSLSLIDLKTKAVKSVISSVSAVSNSLQTVAVNSSTNRAVVVNPLLGAATLVDLAGGSIVSDTIATGAVPLAVAVNPVTNTAVVCNSAGNSLSIINLATLQSTEVTSIPLSNPQGVAIHVPTNTAIISSTSSSEVVLVDLAAMKEVGRISNMTAAAVAAANQTNRQAAVVLPFGNSAALFSVPATDTFTVVSSASFSEYVAPGALASGFGANLASATTTVTTFPLPTSVGGTSVRVGSVDAPLLFVSPTQINFQMPSAATGTQTVQVRVNGTPVATGTINVLTSSPALFTFSSSGAGEVAASRVDGSLVSTNGCLANAKPAAVAETVALFADGQGALQPSLPDGQAAPSSPLSATPKTPQVTIGGVAATVSFSGAAPTFAGLWQINVKIPSVTGANLPVVVTLNGISSYSCGTMSVGVPLTACPH
jgi:uncharacterized protein (TIGR03437 family)